MLTQDAVAILTSPEFINSVLESYPKNELSVVKTVQPLETVCADVLSMSEDSLDKIKTHLQHKVAELLNGDEYKRLKIEASNTYSAADNPNKDKISYTLSIYL